ncbi:uncharacterized protein LOC133803519 [Humulus lupulus]|uniref:uncharacterized protein LOC133803519 n=1 Tax=Humulus lupulus TaxID=3486 RepID=UPI002B413D0D|nr:uncharacterized protein LOC133803519 [Humulus lupulus]
MKGREIKGAPAADLLVCFPSRSHLSLMPKPICSPARSSDPNNQRHHHHNHHLQHLKKSRTRGSTGQASPVLWAKPKSSMGTEMVSEPTSPKVTCAGQIKVRHKTSSCKNWQSVMEEIERMHNSRKQKKARPSWAEALGIKKDVMQFLTCLRNLRFDFRCFGSFHNGADITTDDEDEEEEDDDEDEDEGYRGTLRETGHTDSEASRTVFSKWFMVLQEEQNNNNNEFFKDDRMMKKEEEESTGGEAAVPPPNALMLMRCRSAPGKSWLEEKEEEEKEKQSQDEKNKDRDKYEEEEEESERLEKRCSKNNLKCLMEDENRKTAENNLLVMRYDTKFYKISSDIAKETWVVGGVRDPLSRSRSWKR